jgi:hypothetical protein
MIKKVRSLLFIITLAVFTVSGCGYKMAGLDERAKYDLTISSVYNMTSEPDLERQIEDVAVDFFSSRGILGKNSDSRYIADLRLKKLDFSSRIVTRTGQTGTSSVKGELEITLHDKSGKEVYRHTFSARTIYDLTQDLGKNRTNRNEAIIYVLNQSLRDFYHAFRP